MVACFTQSRCSAAGGASSVITRRLRVRCACKRPKRVKPAMSTNKLIWILAGNRRGDNNQMLALAEALGMPFEAKALAYNRLHHVPLLRRGLLHVERRTRASIQPPWPDLVIGTGPNSPPVARYIRRRSGGQT